MIKKEDLKHDLLLIIVTILLVTFVIGLVTSAPIPEGPEIIPV